MIGAIFGVPLCLPFRPAAAACPPCRAASRPPGAPRTPLATQRAVAPPAAPPGVGPPCLGSAGANCQQRSSGEWRHHLEGMFFNMFNHDFPWFFFLGRNPGKFDCGGFFLLKVSVLGDLYILQVEPKKKRKNKSHHITPSKYDTVTHLASQSHCGPHSHTVSFRGSISASEWCENVWPGL